MKTMTLKQFCASHTAAMQEFERYYSTKVSASTSMNLFDWVDVYERWKASK